MISPTSNNFSAKWFVSTIGSFVLATGTLATPTHGDDPSPGSAIYLKQCASCHGLAGEGSKEYAKPLMGEKSIGQLTRLIEKTMPEDDPGSCVGVDARTVASYIHESFYSRTAQEKNRPARVELSRLTVRQYRNTLADLVGGFRPRVTWSGGSGLQGRYFRSRQLGRDKDLVFSRVDPELQFDFGVEAPRSEDFDRSQFSIVWSGSILAPDTSEYEIIVRSDQAVRLFLNDSKHPLIDASVASAEHTEQRASIFLLGGRAYPIRLEFSKAKQGVDDSKKTKTPPEKKASVALFWKAPGQTEQVVPTRVLSPEAVVESFVSTTSFPPDDRSVGYERGSSISKAWDTAITESAIELTAYVASHLQELSGVQDDDPARSDKLRAFCERFAERAFRRPLTAEQLDRHVTRPFAEAKSLEIAVRRSILAVAKSPYLLYREVACVDSFDVASRLSYGLWDSPPDDSLFDAARENQLVSRDRIVAQAQRMLADVRSKAKVREFFLQWLKVDQAPDIAKDETAYPGFDQAIVADLRASLEMFLEDLVWSSKSDYRRLLDSDEIFLNGRLAGYYGYELPAEAHFQKVTWEGDKRSGVLTHPYLLAHFAYTANSSPIHRGVFLMRSVLGRTLRPPPEAIAPLAPDLHEGLSTRQRVELQTSPKACLNCHSMINPLGFGLENFDAVGRFRRSEKSQDVDASGTYESPEGDFRSYRGARELGAILATSGEAHSAFVAQLFHHQIKQPIRAFGPEVRANLTEFFRSHEFNIQELLVEIIATSALPPKTPGT